MDSRTKRTPQKRGRFLEELARTGYVIKACQYAGLRKGSVYEWREKDAYFAQQWDDALEAYYQKMEAEADRRAVEGTLRPVFWRGEEVGAIREYSDTLLMFRLNGLRPERYRPQPAKDPVMVNVQVNIKHTLREAFTRAYGDDSHTLPSPDGR
jgi:hypothetical protein